MKKNVIFSQLNILLWTLMVSLFQDMEGKGYNQLLVVSIAYIYSYFLVTIVFKIMAKTHFFKFTLIFPSFEDKIENQPLLFRPPVF